MKNVLWWLLFIIGVLGAIYAIPKILARTLSSESPTLTVISNSMYPLLTRGDLIFVQGVSKEELKVGTVIVFHHASGLAVHRVIRLQGDSIITKGDANTDEDVPITFDDVVGRVPNIGNGLAKIPLIGRISLLGSSEPQAAPAVSGGALMQMARYVWNPIGFSMLVLLPALLFFGSLAGDILALLSPSYKRKRLRRKRTERLQKRWAHARVR